MSGHIAVVSGAMWLDERLMPNDVTPDLQNAECQFMLIDDIGGDGLNRCTSHYLLEDSGERQAELCYSPQYAGSKSEYREACTFSFSKY